MHNARKQFYNIFLSYLSAVFIEMNSCLKIDLDFINNEFNHRILEKSYISIFKLY